MEIPSALAAEIAISRQNMALAVIKQSAEAEKAIISILDQSLSVRPATRGQHANFTA